MDVAPSYAFSFIDSVASIDAGDEAVLEFTADLNEDATGEIPMDLLVRYRAQNTAGTSYETFEERIAFALPVSDAPLLNVINVTYLDSFAAGTTENRVLLTIRNDGTDEAEEVRVRALPDISYPFIFEETTEYVASKIAPGESGQVEFTLEILRSADAKVYPVTVRLDSLVGETRYSRDDSITLSVNPGRSVSTVTLGLGVVAIVLIASIWIGIVVWRGRKK
jgi:hypothetical protein